MTEPEERLWSSDEIVQATPLSYRQLDYWTTKRLIQGEPRTVAGIGYPRRYRESQVRLAVAISRLRSTGLDLDVAAALAQVALEDREAIIEMPGVRMTIRIDAGGLIEQQQAASVQPEVEGPGGEEQENPGTGERDAPGPYRRDDRPADVGGGAECPSSR